MTLGDQVTQEDITSALSGVIVGAAWIGGLFAAAPFVGVFGLVPIATLVIEYSPGWFAAAMISLLGFWAKPALIVSLGVGATVLAGGVGVVAGRASAFSGRTAEVIGVTTGLVLTGGLIALSSTTLFSGSLLAGVLIAVIPPVIAGKTLASVSAGETASQQDRRSFTRRSIAIVGSGVVSVGVLRTAVARLSGTTEAPADSNSGSGSDSLPTDVSPPEGNPAFDFGEMPPAITPPADHYVIDKTLTTPEIAAADWQLDIHGAVSKPYTLGYGELLGHEATVEQPTTMVCVSNEIGGNLVGTAHWTGVQLSEIIETAVPADGAIDVVTHATDGYTESFPIEQIRREDILLAYGMGDHQLTAEHGYPARLLIPGRYGMKMTKWITEIELVESDRDGYWTERGWDEEAVLNTGSYIRAVEREGETVQIGGIAFGGLETQFEEIRAVEVSVDGGDSWTEATLESQIGPHIRRRWKYEFDLASETELEIVCRAIRQDGTVQTSEETSPRPAGATGWHRISETV